jgi:hypothetical protein
VLIWVNVAIAAFGVVPDDQCLGHLGRGADGRCSAVVVNSSPWISAPCCRLL